MAYIEVRHSAKRYGSGEQEIIANQDVTFDIEKGELVIILGSSGAGKSTLLSLLQRLDDVHSGVILIDDRDIRSVSQDSLRRQIAVVPQEPALFNRSILENIGYGQPHATEQQIIEAAFGAH